MNTLYTDNVFNGVYLVGAALLYEQNKVYQSKKEAFCLVMLLATPAGSSENNLRERLGSKSQSVHSTDSLPLPPSSALLEVRLQCNLVHYLGCPIVAK